MSDDSSYFLKKIQRLSQALIISGTLNIGVLALLLFWTVRERPPTPYFELKPASSAQQQVPLADNRNCTEFITSLRPLSFDQLVTKLDQIQLIENGYTERDLALSALVDFHYFDLDRALTKEGKPKQKRLLMWKNSLTGESVPLVIYPGLTDAQFESIGQFAKTERWPFRPEGLFLLMQKQKEEQNIDPSLVETFILTPEFLTVELLFKRAEAPIRRQELIEVLLEGDWPLLSQFVEQQRKVNDLSIARRQKFLLDYIHKGSEEAASLLLKVDGEFAVKKLDDAQVISILQLLPTKTQQSEQFALTLLTSPRSKSVWQQASLRLYEYAGEPIPGDWNYQTSLKRFAPSHYVELTPPPKPIVVAPPKITPLAATKPLVVKKPAFPAPTIIEKPLQQVAVTNSSRRAVQKPRIKSPQYRLYIVQEGDSLWKIARRFGVDMEDLKARNQLQKNAIKPGTVLKIP